jgi:hypothetical protein
MFKELAAYIESGFCIFPMKIKKGHEKEPAIYNYLNLATTDFNQILKWSRQFPKCNWGLSCAKSGYVAVDVDVKHAGLEKWAGLLEKQEVPNTRIQKSGGGGFHYLFKAGKDKKYRGKICDGIDIKHNGYIILSPSKHTSTGQQYRWKNWKPVAEVPEWIAELIEKNIDGTTTPIRGIGKGYLKRCVDKLKDEELSYEDWIHAGMALHSAQPNQMGLDLFLRLTEGCNYEEGDTEKAIYKWEGFSSSGGVTHRTLVHLLRSKGITIPSPTHEEDVELFKQAERERLAEKVKTSEGFEEKGERFICWNERKIVDFFNKSGFAFCEMDLKNPFIRIKKGKGKYETKGMNLAALRDLTAPYFFASKKETNFEVKTVYQPAYRSWVESRHRRTFERIIFDPGAKCGASGKVFNLWNGLHYVEHPGEPKVVLDLISTALCDGDVKKRDWFLDFLAHMMQKPAQKPTVVPVFMGKQGAGKGMLTDLIMRPILQDLYLVVKTSTELTDKFNDNQVGKLLTLIDEATWRGNKSEDAILKNIIGSPTLNIEEKFGMKFTVENYSRYVVFSNNKEAVALEVGNRRYCPIYTNDLLADDESYFRPLGRILKKDDVEIGKFFRFLKERDISDFNPYKILEGNTAGMESKIASEGVVAEFWHDVLLENPVHLMYKDHLHKRLTYHEFLNFKRRTSAYEKSVSPKYFWSKTKRLIPVIDEALTVQIRIDGKPERVYGKVGIENMQEAFIETVVIEPETALPVYDEYQLTTFEDATGEMFE